MDPDDILRQIDEESEVATAAEITRLKRKRKGFRAAFAEILKIIDRLITASKGADNRQKNLRAKWNALETRASERKQGKEPSTRD